MNQSTDSRDPRLATIREVECAGLHYGVRGICRFDARHQHRALCVNLLGRGFDGAKPTCRAWLFRERRP